MSQLLSTMLPNLGSEVMLKENLEFVNSNFSANMEAPVESHVSFSMRTKEELKKKGIGYKVFYQKDGKL